MSITVRRIITTGDSLAVVIPKALLRLLELRHGDHVVLVARERGQRHALELVKLEESELLALRSERERGEG